MSGAHTREKRWYRNQNPDGNEGVADRVQAMSKNILVALLEGEEAYQEMLELFDYVGGTPQLVADQLFKEKWQARSTPGVQAVITVDVAAGIVSNPTVTEGGSGFNNGTGFVLTLVLTAGGGDGDAEVTYDVVAGVVTNPTVTVAGTGYNDGSDIVVQEIPTPGVVFETEANADELAVINDMSAAITSIHELYQALTNTAVGQENRIADLRRMS